MNPNPAHHKPKVHWEADKYDASMSFVSQYGEDIVQWLNPQYGEKIVDFGCGTGDLAAQIASYGADILGVDISPEMVERAQSKYPDLSFQCTDGMLWRPTEQCYDAVFSNAALHWMKDAEAAVISMTRAIRSGGRLVAELGGYRNVETIVAAVMETLMEQGQKDAFVMPWYFPKVGEYASLLEKHRMEVKSANLFDRPTKLEDGEQGMKGWLELFGTAMFPHADRSQTDRWIQETVERLKKSSLYNHGYWTADYRRLRIFAVKVT